MTRVALFLFVLLAGIARSAGAAPHVLSPAGPAAARIAQLGFWVLVCFAIVSVVMWLLIFWVGLRRRGTFDEHASWQTEDGRLFIYVGGIAIPAITLAIVFIATLHTMAAFPMADHGDDASIRIVGHQWWWEVQYLADDAGPAFTTANEVHVPAGTPVTIELRSADVIHSFWIPQLHGKVDLVPGVVNHIRIQASEPGVYTGQCAEYCGPEHGKMRLVVMADAPADFAAWAANQRAEARTPTTPAATRGRDVFMSAQCALCHSIRGTTARGGVGPDLTHFASRRGLAANSYERNAGTLAAWVVHAQVLKPDAKMPDIGGLSSDDVGALVAYLQSLH
jgi:cytochrome c oxidase subunit 2